MSSCVLYLSGKQQHISLRINEVPNRIFETYSYLKRAVSRSRRTQMCFIDPARFPSPLTRFLSQPNRFHGGRAAAAGCNGGAKD